MSGHSLIQDARTFTEGLRMSYQRDFHVPRFQSPESGLEKKTPATCGRKLCELFRPSNQDTPFWRMFSGFLALGISEPSFQDWPRSGSMRNGVCWERMMSAHRTGGSGSGYWPTPESQERNAYPRMTKTRACGQNTEPNLAGAVKLWPTPTKQDGENCAGPSQFQRNTLPLNVAVKAGGQPTRRMNATVRPMSANADTDLTCPLENTDALTAKVNPGQQEPAGQLSPDWTEWLMGWPIGLTGLRPLATDKSPYAPRLRFQSWFAGMKKMLEFLSE
jgi:hypothetical protein